MNGLTLHDVAFLAAAMAGGSGPPPQDPDAAAIISAREAADGQPLASSRRLAVDALIADLKAAGLWSLAVQLLVPCGAATLAGAVVPWVGPVPSVRQFTAGDHSPAAGLGRPSNTGAYLDSGVSLSSLAVSSHAIFGYGAISDAEQNRWIAGSIGTSSTSLLELAPWVGAFGGRSARSGSESSQSAAILQSQAPATFMAMSRTSATSLALYVDENVVLNNAPNIFVAAQGAPTLFWYALNYNGMPYGFLSSKLQAFGIFHGLTSQQIITLKLAVQSYVDSVLLTT